MDDDDDNDDDDAVSSTQSPDIEMFFSNSELVSMLFQISAHSHRDNAQLSRDC